MGLERGSRHCLRRQCARGACRNELDGDRTGLDRALVPNHVDMVSALIHEAHPCGVDVRRATRIMSVIGRHSPGGDDDQAMTRMGVPAGGPPGTQTLLWT